MGHSERFYFVDLREGEFGVEYNQVRITAYPPKPSVELLTKRTVREQCEDDELPF